MFPEKSNTKYDREEIVELLLHISLNNEFISSGTEQYQEQNPRQEVPGKNTLYGRLKTIDPDLVLTLLDEVGHQLCEQLKQRKIINSQVDVAIDEHDWRFYGDESDPVRERHGKYTRSEKGTRTQCPIFGAE